VVAAVAAVEQIALKQATWVVGAVVLDLLEMAA
jgi:hypothetical protein